MIITALYNTDDTKNLKCRTFTSIENANEWVDSVSKSSGVVGVRLLVDYANVEHYKVEFEKFQTIVLDGLLTRQPIIAPTTITTLGIKNEND